MTVRSRLVALVGAVALVYLGSAAWILHRTSVVLGPIGLVTMAASRDASAIPRPLALAYQRHVARFDPRAAPSPSSTLIEATLAGCDDGVAAPDGCERFLEIADFFLARGADVNGGSERLGFTPLHAALLWGSPRIARFLLSRGADPRRAVARGPFAGQTPQELLSSLGARGKTPRPHDGELKQLLDEATSK